MNPEEERRRREQKEKDCEFYSSVWKDRKHLCENCGIKLGDEPLTIFFDHILEKSRYPEFRHEPTNIMLLCFSCHSKKTDGYLTPNMEQKKMDLLVSYHKRTK